jgi:hypothetical protein
MINLNYKEIEVEQRSEKRNPTQLFVEVSSADKQDGYHFHALATDSSESGIALHTYIPIPVGSFIDINMAGVLAAKGEVVNLDWDKFDGHNRIRMGVQILEKNEDWLF